MATLGEIAKKTGVSIAAVSRILNHDEKLVVSEGVKISVFKVAHELGYKTPRQKKAKKKVFTIAIADWHIIPSETTIEYSISSIAHAHNLQEVEFTRLKKNEELLVDGIIALGNFSEEEKNHLLLSSSNILFINSNMDLDYSFNRIIVDFDIALEEAIKYLQKRNCSKICYIGGINTFDGITIGKHRTRRMKELLKEKDLFSEDLFFYGNLEKGSGGTFMKMALERKADGIIIASQFLEDSALDVFYSTKQKAELILYRDLELVEELRKPFPTIRMYPSYIWERAVRILLDSTGSQENAMNIYIPAQFDMNPNAQGHKE